VDSLDRGHVLKEEHLLAKQNFLFVEWHADHRRHFLDTVLLDLLQDMRTELHS
jgi:hypothetical protein